ncbi:MAG: NUDIX hydrolase [Actinomycetota bacterium]|nr:NUDIX hydrolase [Actinomycetota bacterium]
MEHAGHPYPAAIEPRAQLALVELDGEQTADPELLAAGQDHLRELTRCSPRLHDGRVLALDRAHSSHLSARRAGYLAAVATTDSLRAEWERQGRGPLRERAHALAAPDPLRTGDGRVAAIGLAAAATHGGRVLVARRSLRLAADPGHWHVAPSGMLEPGAPLEDQLQRELAEELGVAASGAPALLGLGFDLLRLRPELCWSLELYSERVELGDEFAEACWIDPAGAWPEPLTPAAAATLALLAARA